MAEQNRILTTRELLGLARARSRAVSTGKEIEVSGYTRVSYRLRGLLARRARWFDVERAVFRLCRDKDRTGPLPDDKVKARALVALVQDTFGV